jgi:hypothetical protein
MTQNVFKMKRAYKKPSMRVCELRHRPRLLEGSPDSRSIPVDPDRSSPYQW